MSPLVCNVHFLPPMPAMYLATLGLRDAAGRAADKPVLYRVLTYAEMARQTLWLSRPSTIC